MEPSFTGSSQRRDIDSVQMFLYLLETRNSDPVSGQIDPVLFNHPLQFIVPKLSPPFFFSPFPFFFPSFHFAAVFIKMPESKCNTIPLVRSKQHEEQALV